MKRLFILGICIFVLIAFGCADRQSGCNRLIDEIIRCIVNNDAQDLAALTQYPICRKYPLKDIENAEQMITYFDTLFDDSIKTLLSQASTSDWEEVGWRGYMFRNGLLWVSDTGLISINYESNKEKALRKMLIEREKNSLGYNIKEVGWEPECCYKDMDNGSVIRIDKKEDCYRMSIYRLKEQILCLYGIREIMGSLGNVVYTFSDGKRLGRKYEIYGENLYISIDSVDESHELKKSYWLDLIDQ